MGDALNMIRKELGDCKLKIRKLEDLVHKSNLDLSNEHMKRRELIELHKVAENSINEDDMILALGGIVGRKDNE